MCRGVNIVFTRSEQNHFLRVLLNTDIYVRKKFAGELYGRRACGCSLACRGSVYLGIDDNHSLLRSGKTYPSLFANGFPLNIGFYLDRVSHRGFAVEEY